MSPSQARKRLARIRCLLETVKSIQDGQPLPKALCFIPSEVDYVISQDALASNVPNTLRFMVWSKPSTKLGKLVGRINIPESKFKDYFLTAYGQEISNDEGDWARLTSATLGRYPESMFVDSEEEAWILLYARESKSEKIPMLIPRYESEPDKKPSVSKEDLFGGIIFQSSQKKVEEGDKGKCYFKWQNVIESWYMLHVIPPSLPCNVDEAAVELLRTAPPNWSIEADEELVRFIVENCKGHETGLAGANKYVQSVVVSTEQEAANNLLDGDPDTFWESDGSLGRHYIRLHMKPNIIIQQLVIGVDPSDDNYMPSRVMVYGTNDNGQSKMLSDVRVDSNCAGDAVVLENAAEYYHTVEIRIKECKDDGIDCRIHYVKIISSKQKQSGLNRNLFDRDLVRLPKLSSVALEDRDLLYFRAQALLRFAVLLDSVIHFLLPTWDYTAGTFKSIEAIRQLLPLSKKRQVLIENCLRESQGSTPSTVPKIYVNRHLAAEHLVDPAQDPDAKNAIFTQLYEALRPERCDIKLDFRWSQKYDQWWECKFVGEGIIDQGGGFRDSLADMAEELCPSSPESPVPLPYFVRSPNQIMGGTSNVNRDCYVPNSNCKLFAKYEWMGQVMGACLRGKENLVLSLPPFIWKLLNGERVTWDRDYYTVDAAEVKLHEDMKNVTAEKFLENFQGVLTYTTVLCSGSSMPLKPDGERVVVSYEDRLEYVRLVEEKRMNEFQDQIEAIRSGLEKVVPKAVLTLMTWQELERRICGDPEITVEALRKSAHYEDFEDEDDVTIKYLWAALENFTNEDRSRFLRFVTGRRRLPTPLYICRSKSSAPVNSLPESATCSSTLFLPKYSSATVAEEKIRYAAYNCVAIDTDMSPWDE